MADNASAHAFTTRARSILSELESTGQLKRLAMIESPMDAIVKVKGYGECLCFCSNNYLGLANHPEVVDAGIKGLRDYGAGTASVRFICGTFTPHERLERRLAEFLDVDAAYTFVSCWNATEALFPTLCEPGDAIISDALNHACIIDSIRLASVIKKGVNRFVYKNSDMDDLRVQLTKARETIDDEHVIWVVTDGVFSMEGSLAKLPDIRRLCDEFGALLALDDSHGAGVLGRRGKGTHEHYEMPGRAIDMFTGTLGKALGGAAGGYLAGPRHAIDLIVQRGRPTLFSNALPVTVACSANKAVEILQNEPQRVQKLRDNAAYARKGIRGAGFDVIDSPTGICPIMVGDTAKAIRMSKRLLELGVYVIGFGFPVVPEGAARLRVQVSAAHEREHLDGLVEAIRKL